MSLDTSIIVDQSCPDLVKDAVVVNYNEGELYSCALNQADVINNCNKFYIMQLLKRNDGLSYFIVTRSGRVGYGGTGNIDCFLLEDVAVKEFKNIFYDKTGFRWEDRHASAKIDGKYDYIEMKYEHVEEFKEIAELSSKITLDARVQNLVAMIFDVNVYNKVAETYNLDTKRAPLGAISSGQIKKAYAVLSKIAAEIAGAHEPAKLASLSSDFYTVIPTNFGMGPPPIIDTDDLIKDKIELLKILDDVEIMSKLLKRSVGNTNKIEKQYISLNTDIVPVTDGGEYKMLSDYMSKSSGTHYKLKVANIYKISRPEEATKFKAWQGLHNRQLIWHGSGMANYVGILSTGLRINAGNVVKTGSMFGNGLYFANCSTKSAQYMRATDVGIMLLCEVALGNCYERLNADYITKLPTGYHSTHGVGLNTPSQKGHITMSDGVIVPAGSLESRAGHTGSLQYDEFIVYDQSQVRIRYLFILNI